MFGFTKSRHSALSIQASADLAHAQCSVCHALRDIFGLPYALMAGWEPRFLVVLTEAQSESQPSISTVCPAMIGLGRRKASATSVATRYAAAIALTLLRVKVEDKILDERSLGARWVRRIAYEDFEYANLILEQLGFSSAILHDLSKRQSDVEQITSGCSFDDITLPMSDVTAAILAHTAFLSGVSQNTPVLAELGSALGRVMVVADAAEDYVKDYRAGRYNAIVATRPANEPIWPPCSDAISTSVDYIREQLHYINNLAGRIHLRRNHEAVYNLLCLGLRDAAEDRMRILSNAVRLKYKCQSEVSTGNHREIAWPAHFNFSYFSRFTSKSEDAEDADSGGGN